jgi:hypothetical protein
MTEIKERIVDLDFEDTEFKEESKFEDEDTQLISFPRIRPFYINWFWPVY